MGYKHREADHAAALASLATPNYLLKILPHVDDTARVRALLAYILRISCRT